MLKKDDRTGITESIHDEISFICGEKFATRRTFHDFAKQVWQWYFEKSDDYRDYLMLDELFWLTAYRISPMVSEDGREVVTRGVDQNFDNVPEIVDAD